MSNFRLKVFNSVAQHLNFTQAADELCITQPAVSKNIRELEAELKTALFDRIKGKVFLTEAGHIVLQRVKEILEIENQMQYQISTLNGKLAGQLRVGASTTIGQYILPRILAKFNVLYPEVKISLINENTQKIETLLTNKDIDLGLVEGTSKNHQVKYTHFIKDEIVLIAHTSQALSALDEICLMDLKNTPIVLREVGSGSLDIISNRLRKEDVDLSDLKIIMHLGSTESIKNYLTYSNTLGLISIHAISKELLNNEFKIIDIKDFSIERYFNFVQLHGQQKALSEIFMQFALQSITKSYKQ